MNRETAGQRPEQLCLVFQWTTRGLNVTKTPEKMEFYPITLHLQRSLLHSRSEPTPETPPSVTGNTIPFGVMANLLYRSKWCNLSLSFEPGPDQMLRTYLSIDDPRPPAGMEPIQVIVSSGELSLDTETVTRGTYQSPALSPGTYLFKLRQGDETLTEILLELQDAF
jgi:hypothetical protein